MKTLVFGSLNIDHVYRVPHFVRAGETLASTVYQKNAGGKGLNQAIALARAGENVAFAGAIGEDGLFLKEYLSSFGVDTSRVFVLSEPTGHAIIQLNEDGQNGILLYGGANQKISEKIIENALKDFSENDCILLQNEINLLPEIVQCAREKKLRVVLNPSPMREELKALLPYVTDLVLNEVEGNDLTGCTEPEEILSSLLSKYPSCRVLLTLGEKGSVYAEGLRRVYQQAILTKVVDTTAAGDTFTGFFYHCVQDGMSVEKALHIAAQASSIAVGRAGAGISIPSMDEVMERI